MRNLLPLPPACHLGHSYKEASEQVPEPIEETGQDIGQTEIGSDVHSHDAIEHHQVERAVNDEDVPAEQTAKLTGSEQCLQTGTLWFYATPEVPSANSLCTCRMPLCSRECLKDIIDRR